MLKNIRGIIDFKVSGENVYKFINGIRDKHIVCTSQQCREGCFYGQIYRRDEKKAEDIADETGVNIEFTDRHGFRFKAMRYRFRFGIILGIIITFGFVFYCSNIVVSIEVCGNNEITREQVISALADIGIYKGRFIPDINFHSCEQKLRLSIPDIAWTGIRHTGSRIVVDVTEVTAPPEMILDDVPCNIVSAKDAQLIYADVYAGCLMKKIGDGIKKGDIIISGTVEDEKGNILKKHAMGNVIGIYNEEITFTQPFEESGQVYTGSEVNKKYFYFFGYRIPLFFDDTKPETYDYSESVNNFVFLGREIPLGIVNTEYNPFTYDTVTYSEDEADKILEQKTSLHEKNFYDSKGIKVLDREIEKNIKKDCMEYKIIYRLEGNIGTDHEIYVDR